MGQVKVQKPGAGNAGGALPVGAICLWSGAVNAIPGGWALCDGTNGTPDLRGRFVVGAGGGYAVGATGGAESVTLTVEQMPSHSHKAPVSYYVGSSNNVASTQAKYGESINRSSTSETGGNQPHENRPPYYALCYIMKL